MTKHIIVTDNMMFNRHPIGHSAKSRLNFDPATFIGPDRAKDSRGDKLGCLRALDRVCLTTAVSALLPVPTPFSLSKAALEGGMTWFSVATTSLNRWPTVVIDRGRRWDSWMK